RRPPPAAPRSHSTGVTSRPSSRTRPRVVQQPCPPPPWQTRTPPGTSVTVRAGKTRAPSPAAAQAGRPTRAARLGNGGAPDTAYRPYQAKPPAGWTGQGHLVFI